jgi:hypothetical protein
LSRILPTNGAIGRIGQVERRCEKIEGVETGGEVTQAVGRLSSAGSFPPTGWGKREVLT